MHNNYTKNVYVYLKLAVFFLFLYSGLIKWIPFSVDLTLLFGIILVVMMLHDLTFKFKSINLKDFNIILIFSLFYIFSIFYLSTYIYSNSVNYANIKVQGVFMNIIAFTFPFVSINTPDFKIIKKIMMFFTLLMLIFLFYLQKNELFQLFFINQEEQLKLFFASPPTYLVIGSFISVGYLVCINEKHIFSLLYKGAIIYYLLLLSGRGPLFFLLLFVIVNDLLKTNLIKFLIKYSAYVFIGLIIITNVSLEETEINIDRLNIFSNYKQDENTNVRLELMAKSLEYSKSSIVFGYGIGSSGKILTGQDIVAYPHNILIEVLLESGLIGLFLLLLIYIAFATRSVLTNLKITDFAIIYIVYYLILQDMKSGSLEAWRISVGWLGIACIFLSKNNLNIDVRSKQK